MNKSIDELFEEARTSLKNNYAARKIETLIHCSASFL